jgi:ankyrin repeat protein
MHGDAKAIKQLLRASASGLDIDACDADGVTPLMFALLAGHVDAAAVLVKRGARLDATDGHGRTALHWMVFNGLDAEVRWLLRRGASPTTPDRGGRTPLHWACDQPDPACLARLLRALPKATLATAIHAVDQRGMTCLAWVAHHGHAAHMRLLLARGANMSAREATGRSAAHFAACLDDPTCIQLLLAADPLCVQHQDDSGRTPLHLACVHGCRSVVRALLATALRLPAVHQSSGTTEGGDDLGRTPMHCAAAAGRADIAADLLAAGHDPSVADSLHHMPVWYARVKGHADVVALLAQSMVARHHSQQALLAAAAAAANTTPVPPLPRLREALILDSDDDDDGGDALL